ncbi:MAG TPA: HET-C-related protein [Polyangiaceae bacterium]
MSRGIRVKFEPRIEDVLGFRTVLRSRVALLHRGAGTSKAVLSTLKPARLVFHAAFLGEGRSVERAFERFASLSGSVFLDEATGAPRFVCDPSADFEYDAPPPSGDEPVRRLCLTYDDGTFRSPPKADAAAAKLRIPKEPEGSRFLEIAAELAIAGAVESALESNDRVDVPLGPIEVLHTTMPLEQLTGVAKILSASHFSGWLTVVFGHDIPEAAYRLLRRALLSGSYPMPPIDVVSSLGGDNVAGYDRASRRIKVVRQFIKDAEQEPDTAALLAAALIEEYGHFVDDDLRNRLSKVGGDAALDEGALFGYSLINMGWDLTDNAPFARYLRDAEDVELRVHWQTYKGLLDQALGPEEQRSDDMADAIEFFGAGKGHGKPGNSFAHESIEDVLKEGGVDGKRAFNPDEAREIYFGNWLRDYSQAITPNTLLLLKLAGGAIDRGLPGTAKGPTRFETDPRGVITEMLDLYARAEFADLPHFRVTRDRLGVYRSFEHIDNPDGLVTSPLDPGFDRTPSKTLHLRIDASTQMAAYIRERLPRPAMSAAEYMRGELSAALAAGDNPEGRRRLGQGLHTLEDFYAHTNFCELFLRKVGKKTVEPWVPELTEGGKKFFPLVSGIFGGDDTAASIFLALAEIMEADKDKKCEAGLRSIAVKMAILVVRDLRPHIGKQIDAALKDVEKFQSDHPIIFNLVCNTLGAVMRFLTWLYGVVARLLANQIDEAQILLRDGKPTTSPTHTQLAKDHDDHPLHRLAAKCAQIAVRDIGDLMFVAWKQRPPGVPVPTEAQILNTAESYLVHPDLIALPPTAGLAAITRQVEAFAKDPANAGAIQRASTRTATVDHLGELQRRAEELTKFIPIDRLKRMFGF